MLLCLAAILVESRTVVAPTFPLTIQSIMRGRALIGHAPRNLQWSADSKHLTFSWAKADGSADPTYLNYEIDANGTGLRKGDGSSWPEPLTKPAKTVPVPTKQAILSEGDIYVKTADQPAKRLTTGAHIQSAPKISTDGTVIAHLKDGALYSIDTDTAKSTLLAEKDLIASPSTPAVDGPTAFETFLAKEQTKLFKAFAPTAGSARETATTRDQGPFRNLGGNSELNLTPSGMHVSFSLFTPGVNGRNTEVPAYVTRSGFTETIRSYPKLGSVDGSSKLLLINIKTGVKTEIASPRPGRVGQLRWAPNNQSAVVWVQSNDHKDAWLYGFDPKTDKLTMLWNEHDDAWIGGPGRGLLGWLPDSSRVYFESENSGFANLMSVDPLGTNPKNLTSGPYEVSNVELDEAHRRFVFVSSEGSPFKRHIDAMNFDGTEKMQLSEYSADEDATFEIAPDGKSIAVVKSTSTSPAELFVNGKQVTSTPSEEWKSRDWLVPKTVLIPAQDGEAVPARFYLPKKWRKGGPAVIFVHGAGYLQNVFDAWSHYYREYMFHNMLVERGYAVLDIDYRGSAGYGKKWRTAIYRHMGGTDLTDQVAGANWLINTHGVAKDRIGIYGGSYGGFLTLMAMFTTPDVFAAGAALRPVSDWAHYNQGYTSNILNLPIDDPEPYRLSSPIYHAEGLKGALLICHGMVDTNVHFQDSVRLAERLIELGKTNWTLAPFPVENHDFQRPESWVDEYTRIYDLFERTIGPNRIKK